MPLMNCWEFMECQREPGGIKSGELGVCPASIAAELNGINKGKNGGRICWEIAGTMCESGPKGTFAQKFHECHVCPFFSLVKAEQDTEFTRKIGDKKPG
ncbi:MAG TPA: hypothetical protein P5511_07330 [Candidatus Goldiibacteriota bacterium]|nr:hypothetical protein [Candidatus Goldiibacteriota bacterium]